MSLGGLVDKTVVTGSIPAMECLFFFLVLFLITPIRIYGVQRVKHCGVHNIYIYIYICT